MWYIFFGVGKGVIMLRKFSIVICALSSTFSVIRYFTNYDDLFVFWSYNSGTWVSGTDYLHIFFVALAVASFVGIFIFKEDSKSDSQPK